MRKGNQNRSSLNKEDFLIFQFKLKVIFETGQHLSYEQLSSSSNGSFKARYMKGRSSSITDRNAGVRLLLGPRSQVQLQVPGYRLGRDCGGLRVDFSLLFILQFLLLGFSLFSPLEVVQAQGTAATVDGEQLGGDRLGVGQPETGSPNSGTSNFSRPKDLYPGEEVTTAGGKKMRIWSTESPERSFPAPQVPIPPTVTVVPVPVGPRTPDYGDLVPPNVGHRHSGDWTHENERGRH